MQSCPTCPTSGGSKIATKLAQSWSHGKLVGERVGQWGKIARLFGNLALIIVRNPRHIVHILILDFDKDI